MQKPINLAISILSIALLVACGGGGNPPSKREAELEKELQALKQEKEQKCTELFKAIEREVKLPKTIGEVSSMNKDEENAFALIEGIKFLLRAFIVGEGSVYDIIKSAQVFYERYIVEEVKEIEKKDPSSITGVENICLVFTKVLPQLIECLEKKHNKQEELANLRKKHR